MPGLPAGSVYGEYESALDGNATLALAGYDHIEGPDFYRKNELLDEKYLKKAEKKKEEETQEPEAKALSDGELQR